MGTHTTHLDYIAVSTDTSVFRSAYYDIDTNEIKFYEEQSEEILEQQN